MQNREIAVKLEKLGEFLDRHRLDGVILGQRNNFAWITGGRNNMIPNNAAAGVAASSWSAGARSSPALVSASITFGRYCA